MEGHDASLEDLLEVRMGLEGQSVILAAQRATAEDLRVVGKRPWRPCSRKTMPAAWG